MLSHGRNQSKKMKTPVVKFKFALVVSGRIIQEHVIDLTTSKFETVEQVSITLQGLTKVSDELFVRTQAGGTYMLDTLVTKPKQEQKPKWKKKQPFKQFSSSDASNVAAKLGLKKRNTK